MILRAAELLLISGKAAAISTRSFPGGPLKKNGPGFFDAGTEIHSIQLWQGKYLSSSRLPRITNRSGPAGDVARAFNGRSASITSRAGRPRRAVRGRGRPGGSKICRRSAPKKSVPDFWMKGPKFRSCRAGRSNTQVLAPLASAASQESGRRAQGARSQQVVLG
jgi:hypothetical protein